MYALQSCYGPVSVMCPVSKSPHMLTGKAFSKALRGHFIVDFALHVLLTRTHLEQLGTEELNALKEIYAITASSHAEEVEQPVNECFVPLDVFSIVLKSKFQSFLSRIYLKVRYCLCYGPLTWLYYMLPEFHKVLTAA